MQAFIPNTSAWFDFQIQTGLESVDLVNIFLNNLNISPLHISMMTVGVTANVQVPLNRFDDSFVASFSKDERFAFRSLSGACGVAPSKFNSSKELKINFNGGNKYILIFKNSFQIAGCKHVQDATTIVSAIFQHLAIPLDADNLICDTRLFNTNFSIGKALNMALLHQEIIKEFRHATFNPDLPLKGIKIPFSKNNQSVAIIIYAKGRIVMTGAKEISLVVDAYRAIVGFLDEHPEVMSELQADLKKVPGKRGRKRKSEVDLIYNEILDLL